MNLINLFATYFSHSSFVTIVVLGWLSLYFIITLSIFISRIFSLNSLKNTEISSLNQLILGSKAVRNDSVLKAYINQNNPNLLDVCKAKVEQHSSIGFSWLSIIASTSPFIGLFGTVVSILETFANLGEAGANIAMIAPAISEALVATAAGILVAIPAYTFHALLKRQAYGLINLIDQQILLLKYSFKKEKELE